VPDTFAETDQGLLLVANGINPMLRWNGFSPQAEAAGVAFPTQALTLSGTGLGPIVGSYTAYLRFVDQYGNFSSLSPISNVYTAASSSGTVVDATFTTPIVINAPGHGLLSGAVVQIIGCFGNTAANGTWVIAVVDGDNFALAYDFISGITPAGNDFYQGGGTYIAGVAGITYTNVAVPQEPKVVRRQILRNTNGQSTTYYVEIDTTDLTSTTLTGPGYDDPVLSAQPFYNVLDANNNGFFHQFDPPPSWKQSIQQLQDRMFAAADGEYTEGCVALTFGSTQVQGNSTIWPANFAGRFLYPTLGDRNYQIASVNTTTQTLTLTQPYTGTTNPYALYAIRPAPAERHLVYYSEPGLPEAFPPTNAFALQEDGDNITSLMTKTTYLYVQKRRRTFRFSFSADPASDGFVTVAYDRGCINPRCWVKVEGKAYIMDEQGIYSFSEGGDASVNSISEVLQDIFTTQGAPYQINWQAKKFFHCVANEQEETIRWFVCLGGSYLPQHALCYQYRTDNWWFEYYSVPIGASIMGRIQGQRQMFLGTSARRILAASLGTLDGANPQKGTVQGTVTAAGICTLTDSSADFDNTMSNIPVVIVTGRAAGQTRLITTVLSNTQVRISQPWSILPAVGDVYQVGGILWRWKSKQFRQQLMGPDQDKNIPRRIEVDFQPCASPTSILLSAFLDRSTVPFNWTGNVTSSDGDGIAVADGSPTLVGDMTKTNGFLKKRVDGHLELYAEGNRFVQWQLEGVQNQDRVILHEVVIDGVIGA
jgi:hypothetical protein